MEQIKNRQENKQKIIKELKQEINGKIFFTMFGNTEYAGTFIDCNEGGAFTFRTSDGVGMTKKVSLEEVQELLKNGRSQNFFE